MPGKPTSRTLSRHLFEHIQTLNELAVFLWLARRKEAAFGVSTIAQAVGVEEGLVRGVLARLTDAGLVVRHRSAPKLFRYALPLTPPEYLLESLCAEHRKG